MSGSREVKAGGEREEENTAEPPGRKVRSAANAKASHHGGHRRQVWASGTGFGGDSLAHSMGMGVNGWYSSLGLPLGAGNGAVVRQPSKIMETVVKAKEAEKQLDARLEAAMRHIADILTRVDGVGSNCSWGTPGLTVLTAPTASLLRTRGTVAQVARHLASNDSIMDISDRSELYLTLLALLRALGSHEELLPLLCDPTAGENREPLGQASAHGESSLSVLDALEKLYSQSRLMLGSFQKFMGEDDEVFDIGLVSELCDCVEALRTSVSSWHANQRKLCQRLWLLPPSRMIYRQNSLPPTGSKQLKERAQSE